MGTNHRKIADIRRNGLKPRAGWVSRETSQSNKRNFDTEPAHRAGGVYFTYVDDFARWIERRVVRAARQ